MNKYHNRNRIISPIMTIHDILTLHILYSFLPLFFPPSLSFLPLFLPFPLFLLSFLSLSLSLSSLFPSFIPSSLPLCFLCLLS